MKKILLLFIAISMGYTSQAQQSGTPLDIDAAKNLIESYIAPFGNSVGAGLNNGWYNTAKPHKLGGFDVTVTANLVLINNDVKSFAVDNIVEGSMFNGSGESSTILGNTDGVNIEVDEGGGTTSTIQLPSGLNIPIIPLPMLQAGIGLVKGTEINLRYIPDIEIGDNKGKIGVIGFGVKHDILQWLPVVDKIPIDLSIQAGYTKITSSIPLRDPNSWVEDTDAELDIGATTINLVLSKKLLMFTPYVGIGYNSSKTAFRVNGKYNIINSLDDPNTPNNESLEYIPVAALTEFEFETNNDLRTNIGFRFNLAIIALQANYTFSEYPTATLGIGISVR